MQVRFYATLRSIVGGKTAELDPGSRGDVRGVLEAACARFPALAPLIWTESGELGDYIKVFVDGREIRHLQMLDTPVSADQSIDVFPPVAGG